MATEAAIRSGTVHAYTIPTDAPEADGNIAWNSTTLFVVELHAANSINICYTYAHPAAATVARQPIENTASTKTLSIPMTSSPHARIAAQVRSEGIGATTLFAADIALWDLKAKLLKEPLLQTFPTSNRTHINRQNALPKADHPAKILRAPARNSTLSSLSSALPALVPSQTSRTHSQRV